MASDPGRGRNGNDDDDLTADPPAFSEEGMRRIIYRQDAQGDSRTTAFDDDTAELEAGLKGRRSLVPIVTALAAVISFGAIVWYAYTWGTGQMASEELPVVRAEPMPEKTKPAQPGGMDVPHQDKLVLNDGAPAGEEPQVERLLPAPEIPQPPEPMEAPVETAEAGGEAAPPEDAVEAPLMSEAPVPPPEVTAPEVTAPAESAEEPAAAEAPGAETAGVAKPVPKPRTDSGDQIAELLEEAPLETANGDTAAPEAPAQPSTQTPTQTAALTEGDVVLQLASVKSEDAAAREWARLQKAHPDELAARSLSLDTAVVQGATYYRVQTGPFASRDAAGKVCAALKARNQDCLVTQR